jgi:hypothetical protein
MYSKQSGWVWQRTGTAAVFSEKTQPETHCIVTLCGPGVLDYMEYQHVEYVFRLMFSMHLTNASTRVSKFIWQIDNAAVMSRIPTLLPSLRRLATILGSDFTPRSTVRTW